MNFRIALNHQHWTSKNNKAKQKQGGYKNVYLGALITSFARQLLAMYQLLKPYGFVPFVLFVSGK